VREQIVVLRPKYPSFRAVLRRHEAVRVAGAHEAVGGVLAQEAGFQAVWSSSFEISAARCLPDASLLTMTEYLQAAANIQKALRVPVVADCDSGYGNNLNMAHMVHEYEAAGITAVCVEDKLYPKMNSFAGGNQALLPTVDFGRKIAVGKAAQQTAEFFLIARTEALICGLGVDETLRRCAAYADAGCDAVLVHSKAPTRDEVTAFLDEWDGRCPVVLVPTTYPDWHFDDVVKAGASVVIYANQGLRATVSALRDTFRTLLERGESTPLESRIASVADIFELQQLAAWQQLEA
jgi:phosphoenolpyruvate phosphomutase